MTANQTSERSNQLRRTQAVGSSRDLRDRMLKAMGQLEAALAIASVQRETTWREQVRQSLDTLEETMRNQSTDLTGEDGLLAELLLEEPRLDPRVERLRQHYAELMQQIHDLQSQFAIRQTESPAAVSQMRDQLGAFVTALRQFQYEETDLIYEAIQVDIGAQD